MITIQTKAMNEARMVKIGLKISTLSFSNFRRKTFVDTYFDIPKVLLYIKMIYMILMNSYLKCYHV